MRGLTLRTLDAVRQFWLPIESEQVPLLTARIPAITRIVLIASLSLSTAVHAADVLQGRADPAPMLALWTLTSGATVLMLAALRTELGRKNAERIAAVAVMVTQLEIVATGYALGVETNPAFAAFTVIPFGYSAFLAWRWQYAVLVGIFGVFVLGVLGIGLGIVSPELAEVRIGLCTSTAVLGAIVSQLHRREALSLALASAQGRVIAADRLAQMGRVSAALAHELKTPLAATQNQLSIMASLLDELQESIGHEGVEPEDLREIVGEARAARKAGSDATERVARIVQSMRDQTRLAAPGSRSQFSAKARVLANLVLLRGRVRTAGVRIEVKGDKGACEGPVVQFDQVCINVLRNAIDAMVNRGVGTQVLVTVTTQVGGVQVRFDDDGPGVNPTVRDRIFDQGFSTKAVDENLGLGLWLCRNIVVSGFSGSLELVDGTAGGASFVLWIPTRKSGEH